MNKKLKDCKFVCGCKHINGCAQTYYFGAYDETIKVGDYVAVNQSNGFCQVMVVDSVMSKEDSKAAWSAIHKEVLGKINYDPFLEHEKKVKRIAQLEKDMKARVKEIEVKKTVDYYASIDDEYAAMLEELRSLNGE